MFWTSVGSLHFNHFSIYWPHGGKGSVKKNDSFYYFSNSMLGQEGETKSSKNFGGFLEDMFVFS